MTPVEFKHLNTTIHEGVLDSDSIYLIINIKVSVSNVYRLINTQ